MNSAPPLTRGFKWLNATQFLGALNDNTFRWLMFFALVGHLGPDSSSRILQVVAVVFALPFLLFTPWAGNLADRCSKTRLIRAAKAAEVLIMGLGCLALAQGRTTGLYGVLFLMCLQSAFFGPSKYGIVPELVSPEALSRANAALSGWTYLAIVGGTVLAGSLSVTTGRHYALAGLVCLGIAGLGLVTGWRIPHCRAQAPQRPLIPTPGETLARTLRTVGADTNLLLAVLAGAVFTCLAGFLQVNLSPYGIEHLNLTQEQSTGLFLVAAVGIGLGSWAAGRLSGRHVEIGLVPLGALGLAAGAGVLALLPAGRLVGAALALAFVGFSAGLFVVPIRALIQLRSPQAQRGQVVAASALLGWVGVLLAAGILTLADRVLGLSTAQAFGILTALSALLATACILRLPDFLVRFMIVTVVRRLYRIRVFGSEHIPQRGGALLVANHVTYADALIVAATQQRRIRFLMSRQVFATSRFQWLCRLMGTILISENDPPKRIVRSLQEARRALDDGYLVCIFAEGALTRTGTLGRFKPGLERIVRGSEHPVIPLYLGGLWGSVFSYARGRMGGCPRRIPYPVNVHIAPPLAATVRTWQVKQRIQELSCRDWDLRRARRRPLVHRVIGRARRHWRRPCLSDRTGRRLTYGRSLVAACLLARRLGPRRREPESIGILLPASVAAALANLAAALRRAPAVNLNYTLTPAELRDQAARCDLRRVLTSRAFLSRLGLAADTLPFVFVEDLLGQASTAQRLGALLAARLAPRRLLCPCRDFNADDTAAILFSSGSTGRSKAVLLSHHNLLSNLEQMRAVFPLTGADRVCGVLPLFHSFGLSVTCWLPLVAGAAVDFVPNPLDPAAVGASVRETGASLLLAAPTFLVGYLRRVPPADFRSLRRVIVGSEPLRPKLAERFEQRFGVRPREGYGATELSPVVALNLPDRTAGGHTQAGSRPGTVGLPLPGQALKVTDPDTGRPLGPGESGLLWVRGPNVMRGYLGDPERTAEVLRDGWYNTGDMARIDEDGFVTLTGRLSRFSKIGGEMVSHGRLEAFCQEALAATEPVVAVAGAPDPRKGERLVLFYRAGAVGGDRLFDLLRTGDLPAVSRPRRCDLVPVPDLPRLGSGKLDLGRLKQWARDHHPAAALAG